MKFHRRSGAIAAVAIGCILAAGCAPTKQWLEPRVCNYEEFEGDLPPDEIARIVALHQIDRAHHTANTEETLAARRLETAAEEAAAEAVPYREPEELAGEPINPAVADSTVTFDSDDAKEAFEQRHGLELADNTRVYRGAFKGSDHSIVAIHRPGESVELRDGDRHIAAISVDAFVDEPPPEDLIPFEPGAVELVQDGTHQLKLLHAEQNEETGEIVYRLRIYKFIGSHIGTIFDKPIAVAGGEDDASVQLLADVRFLHGIDHRVIEWTPVDADGEPSDEAIKYEWNRWEGVYRIPEPPPTTPEHFSAL